MSNVKIEIKFGELSFTGEGEAEWIEKQLDKILERLEILSHLHKKTEHKGPIEASHVPMEEDSKIAGLALPAFLKEKAATTVQVKKFLATAIWLEARGNRNLRTADVTEALQKSQIGKINNPADCLNKNVRKGFCEKNGDEFFVTQEGKDSL